jgi:sodium-coupled neutral amino acid transporter 11
MILSGMAASSYSGHFSAPAFYHSTQGQEDKTTDNATTEPTDNPKALRDFFKVAVGGFSTVTIINCLVMAFGFLTFGGNSNGVILNNFSTMDPGASFCRLLMAVCVLGGYPLLISGCRGEILALWKRKSHKEITRQHEKTVTSILLSLVTAGALTMKDAGFVIGFNGAVMGSALLYIFPTLLFLSRTSKMTTLSKRLRLERWFCKFVTAFGVFSAVVGGGASVIGAYFPHLLL